jgi:hypothetical protein
LYPRVTGGEYVFQGKSYNSQRHLGTKFATVNAIGKVTDLGLQGFKTNSTGDNVSINPIVSAGLFQVDTNPPTAILLADGVKIGGSASDPFNFSVLEVKPKNSLLSIFYETSTSGLISELNLDIENGASSSEVSPQPPLSPDS